MVAFYRARSGGEDTLARNPDTRKERKQRSRDKDMASMRLRGQGTLVVVRDSGARDFPDRRTHGLATRSRIPT